MTNARDRQHAVALVNEAHQAGARLSRACRELSIGLNTYRRWSSRPEDGRPHAVHGTPSHALSDAERQAVLQTCHRLEFASLPPAQIVVRLLDEENRYLASESTFYRTFAPGPRAASPRPGSGSTPLWPTSAPSR